MTIFGIRIMRERTFRAYEAHCVGLLKVAEQDIEMLKVKYYYAKARALTAERRREITVEPYHRGVRLIIGEPPGPNPNDERRDRLALDLRDGRV